MLAYKGTHMEFKQALGIAFKEVRIAKNLTQEDFGVVSSRTYISTIERGLKSVTLDKLNELSNVLGVSTLTLVFMAHLKLDQSRSSEKIIKEVLSELNSIADVTR